MFVESSIGSVYDGYSCILYIFVCMLFDCAMIRVLFMFIVNNAISGNGKRQQQKQNQSTTISALLSATENK